MQSTAASVVRASTSKADQRGSGTAGGNCGVTGDDCGVKNATPVADRMGIGNGGTFDGDGVDGYSWPGRLSMSQLAGKAVDGKAGRGGKQSTAKLAGEGGVETAKLAREAVDGETGDDCGVDGGDCAVKNTTSVEERVGVDNGDRGGDGVDGKIWQEREAVDGRAGRGGRQSMSNLAGEAAVQPVVMALTSKQTGDAVDRSIGGEGIDEQS